MSRIFWRSPLFLGLVGTVVVAAVGVISLGQGQYLRTQVAVPPASDQGSLQVTQYAAEANIEAIISGLLGEPLEVLHRWPGKLGNVEGVYWARASRLADTVAPDGPRAFVPRQAPTQVVAIPAPPYPASVEAAMENFQLK